MPLLCQARRRLPKRLGEQSFSRESAGFCTKIEITPLGSGGAGPTPLGEVVGANRNDQANVRGLRRLRTGVNRRWDSYPLKTLVLRKLCVDVVLIGGDVFRAELTSLELALPHQLVDPELDIAVLV